MTMAAPMATSHFFLLRTPPSHTLPSKSLNQLFLSSQSHTPRKSLALRLGLLFPAAHNPSFCVLASASPSSCPSSSPRPFPNIPVASVLTGPTRIATTVLSLTLALSGLILKLFQNIYPTLVSPIFQYPKLQLGLINAASPLFFAALRDRPRGSLNTPLTVVAAGLGKWLDIYSGVLMVRVLLSWFPNIPWDRQPLSAIRDLCDPYLNLFRNIIPPIFDTLDVSPLLAFAVLGLLGSIMHGAISPALFSSLPSSSLSRELTVMLGKVMLGQKVKWKVLCRCTFEVHIFYFCL